MNWLDMFNDPLVRAALLWVGGFLMSKFGNVVTKALPVILLVLNALLEGLRIMFPGNADAAMLAEFSPNRGLGSFLLNILLPVLLAVGANSGSKNTVEWVRVGGALLKRRQ